MAGDSFLLLSVALRRAPKERSREYVEQGAREEVPGLRVSPLLHFEDYHSIRSLPRKEQGKHIAKANVSIEKTSEKIGATLVSANTSPCASRETCTPRGG